MNLQGWVLEPEGPWVAAVSRISINSSLTGWSENDLTARWWRKRSETSSIGCITTPPGRHSSAIGSRSVDGSRLPTPGGPACLDPPITEGIDPPHQELEPRLQPTAMVTLRVTWRLKTRRAD